MKAFCCVMAAKLHKLIINSSCKATVIECFFSDESHAFCYYGKQVYLPLYAHWETLFPVQSDNTEFVAMTNSWYDRGGGNLIQSTLCLRAHNGLEEILKMRVCVWKSLVWTDPLLKMSLCYFKEGLGLGLCIQQPPTNTTTSPTPP